MPKSTRNLAEWLEHAGLNVEQFADISGVDRKVVEAIVAGRYTPSPQQRRRAADALGIDPGDISWGHVAGVDPLYGHGPQFGRSP